MEWTAEAPLSFTPLNWDAYTYQSFPSGHSTTAFSLALTIAFLWPRSFWPMLGFAALVALSRIVVGQHYVTDITAGALLGTLGAFAVRNFFVSRGWLFEKAESGEIARRPFEPTR
jgi:undecaprenyl-diphosphatase